MPPLELLVASFTTFFVTIDPLGVVPIFVSLTARFTPARRRTVALTGTAVATVVLLAFLLAGERILGALGITMPAFRIAGGLLLLMIATEMLFQRRNSRRAQTAESVSADEGDDVAVFPLAVPLLAGPGAISASVLSMSAQAGQLAGQVAVVAMLLLVMAIALVLLLLAGRVATLLPRSMIDVITRLLGMLLAALAVQFVLDGVFATLAARGYAG